MLLPGVVVAIEAREGPHGRLRFRDKVRALVDDAAGHVRLAAEAGFAQLVVQFANALGRGHARLGARVVIHIRWCAVSHSVMCVLG